MLHKKREADRMLEWQVGGWEQICRVTALMPLDGLDGRDGQPSRKYLY